jgi:hypothetical protein
MKYLVIALTAVLVLLMACSKDKFQTKPSLEVKSANKSLDVGENFSASLTFTDKEGDVDSVIYIIRERINNGGKRTVSDDYTVPEFPNISKGDIQVTLDYYLQLTQGFTAIVLGGVRQADTMNIKFVLKDRANNLSDTAIVSNVVIKR